jgi:hypothetical protein
MQYLELRIKTVVHRDAGCRARRILSQVILFKTKFVLHSGKQLIPIAWVIEEVLGGHGG